MGAAAGQRQVAAPKTYISEQRARDILGTCLRDAGYRVLADWKLELGSTLLVLDGFDPEAEVGYEYWSAPQNEGRSLPQLASPRLLLLDGGEPAELVRVCSEFVNSLKGDPS